jgi:hypothetical protein
MAITMAIPNGNSMCGPGKSNDCLQSRTLKDHTRSNMTDMTGRLEPRVLEASAQQQ